MSMTRKEAAKIIRRADDYIIVKENDADKDFVMSSVLNEAVDLAVSALRAPTRGQVERMRGEWINTNKDAGRMCKCSKCGYPVSYFGELFCPNCGAPMTDKAVDMMLERWKEVVKNE